MDKGLLGRLRRRGQAVKYHPAETYISFNFYGTTTFSMLRFLFRIPDGMWVGIFGVMMWIEVQSSLVLG